MELKTKLHFLRNRCGWIALKMRIFNLLWRFANNQLDKIETQLDNKMATYFFHSIEHLTIDEQIDNIWDHKNGTKTACRFPEHITSQVGRKWVANHATAILHHNCTNT